MDFKEFLILIWQKKVAVFSIVLVFLAIATIFIILTPLKYGAESKLVVIQDPPENESIYAVNQSRVHLSKLLAEAVGSSSFFKKVLNSGYNIDEDYFSPAGDSKEMIVNWRESIDASFAEESGGIIKITVYHTDKAEAGRIAEAVNSVLRSEHSDFHSLGNRVSINVIDGPMVSDLPTDPNVFLVFALTLVLGLTVAVSYVYLFSPLSIRSEKEKKKRISAPLEDYPAYTRGPSNLLVENPVSRPSAQEEQDQVDASIPIIQEDPEKYLNPDLKSDKKEGEQIEQKENQEEEGLFQGSVEKKGGSVSEDKDRVSPEEIENKGDIRNIFG